MGTIKNIKSWIHEERKRIESLLKETLLIVVLLGAGRKGIKKRREIAKKLEENGIVALIPEDDFAPDVAPSLIEEAIFKEADVDLIFINVESWGSATEFVQFYDNAIIAPKLRILTHYRYHPIYGGSQGYLTDLYLSFMAKYGHVYAYGEENNFPAPEKIILILSLRYKFLKALGKVR